MTSSKKYAFFLPNTFTALNMACGFAAIVFSFKGEFYSGCMILILGAIFDSVDGRVARATGTQSVFGEQFDSLSDLVSFGVAPGFLVYNMFFSGMGKIGIGLSFFYVLCGALRLARFNANIDKVHPNFFQGLPIPSGALAIVGLVLLSQELPVILEYKIVTVPYILIYSALMISNIPFCSFKNSGFVKNHKKGVLFIIFLLLLLLLTYEKFFLSAGLGIYVIGSFIYYMAKKGELGNIFKWKNEEE